MKMLKELKWEAILTGVLYILLGIVALVIPETMQKTLGYLIGIVLIVAGLVSIICYLLRDARENYYHNEFVFGILGIVLGAVVLYKVEIVISLIPFILGVLVLCSGCSKLQDAIDLKRLGYGSWLGLLIVAAINIILGVVLIYNPFKAAILLFRVLGVVLILSGAGDCFLRFILHASSGDSNRSRMPWTVPSKRSTLRIKINGHKRTGRRNIVNIASFCPRRRRLLFFGTI